jgi:hypothetical protein
METHNRRIRFVLVVVRGEMVRVAARSVAAREAEDVLCHTRQKLCLSAS